MPTKQLANFHREINQIADKLRKAQAEVQNHEGVKHVFAKVIRDISQSEEQYKASTKTKAEEAEKAQRLAKASRQEVIDMRETGETVSRQANMCKSLNQTVIDLQAQNARYSVQVEAAAAAAANTATEMGALQSKIATMKNNADTEKVRYNKSLLQQSPMSLNWGFNC